MKDVALHLVEIEFKNKVDKGGAPYISHLTKVAENTKKYNTIEFYSETLETIGLLHDLIEDYDHWTPAHIDAIFNDANISNTLILLTKTADVNYEQYIERIGHNYLAIVVKLADLEHNMDITRLPKLKEKDIARLKKYHKSYQYLLTKLNEHLNVE